MVLVCQLMELRKQETVSTMDTVEKSYSCNFRHNQLLLATLEKSQLSYFPLITLIITDYYATKILVYYNLLPKIICIL